MRSPVTAVIESFNALTEEQKKQKKLCLDFTALEPEQEAPTKPPRRPRTPRTGLPAVIAKTSKDGADDAGKTSDTEPKCAICYQPADHSDHDLTYLSSHQFEAPKSVASATRRSSRKGAGTNSERPPDFGSTTPEVSKSASAGG